MSDWSESLARWIVDVYAAATILLLAAAAAAAFLRQPARRLAVAWAGVAALGGLAVLAAVPGWPRLHWLPATPIAQTAWTGEVTLAPGDSAAAREGAAEASEENLAIDVVSVERAWLELRGRAASVSDGAGPTSSELTAELRLEKPEPAAFSLAWRVAPTAGLLGWQEWVVVVFAAGGTLAFAWLLVGAARAVWLCRHSREAPAALRKLLAKVVGRTSQQPRLGLNDALGQPVALGAVYPAILLPGQLAEQIAPPQVEAVLAHEWAHIRSGHLWLLAVTRLLLVVFFAHPLYWWLRHRIRQDQEAIAGAAAVAGGNAVEYAATLVAWFRLGGEHHAATALAFGGRPSQLKRRIAMLLNPEWRVETNCPGRWRWGVGALAGVAVLALSVVTLRPASPVLADEPVEKAAPQQEVKPDAAPASKTTELMKQAPAAARPTGKTYAAVILSGKVLGPDDKPIGGAAVTVVAWRKHRSGRTEILGQTKTDAHGNFKLSTMVPVPADQFEVVTIGSAPGFGPGWFTGASADAKIHLAPEQVVRGRLIDLQGQPAAGVKVYVSRVGERHAGDTVWAYNVNDTFSVDDTTAEDHETGLDHPNAALANLLVGTQIRTANGQMMVSVRADGSITPAPQAPAVGFSDPATAPAFWPQPVTTDAQGRFTIRGVGRGQGLGLQVRDDRFALQVLDVPAADKDKAEEVTLPLAPARVLEGVVRAADTGQPVPHARLSVGGPHAGTISFVIDGVGGGGYGGADWKGRRGMGTGTATADLLFAYSRFENSLHELPSLDVQADENGRYRLNLVLADSVNVRVAAPDGEPFLKKTQALSWRKGATRQTFDVELPRAVPVHGKVTQAGQPVAGARVDFWSKGLKMPEGVRWPAAAKTGKDGTFRALLPPGLWYLVVNAAASEYVCQRIPFGRLSDEQVPAFQSDGAREDAGKPGEEPSFYPDAWKSLEVSAGGKSIDVSLELSRVVLKGRVLDPDGQPVAKAAVYFRHPTPPDPAGSLTSRSAGVRQAIAFDLFTEIGKDVTGRRGEQGPPPQPLAVKDGQFELPLRDLDRPYLLFFFDAEAGLGAAAEFTGKQAGDPVTIKLTPCGQATARFVDGEGKPMAGYQPLLWLPLPVQEAVNKDFAFHFDDNLKSDRAVWAGHMLPAAFGDLRTDAEGRVTFKGLIPGAAYGVWLSRDWKDFKFEGDKGWRDFRVPSGKTVDLGDITIKRVTLKPVKEVKEVKVEVIDGVKDEPEPEPPAK
jgi:beta-lactamase regulating signal transducer with metallopeptidase domain/protocatechuate 3,4-dioxygenase beta subunit